MAEFEESGHIMRRILATSRGLPLDPTGGLTTPSRPPAGSCAP